MARGVGPDGEDLFAPTAIVVSVPATNQSVDDVLAILALHGIADDE